MALTTRLAFLLIAGALTACGSDDNGDSGAPQEPAAHPAPASPALRQWTAPTLLELNPGTASSPLIATDDAGNALALWVQTGSAPRSLHAAFYDSDTGAWRVNQVISSGTGTVDATPVYDDFLAAPRIQLAFAENGNALAVWAEARAGANELWFNTFDSATSTWGTAERVVNQLDIPAQIPDPNAVPNPDPAAPPQLIDNPAYIAGAQSHPALAVNADGNGLLAWVQTADDKQRVRAASFDAATKAWREHQQELDSDVLTEEYTQTRLFAYPQVVLDAQGNGLVAWIKRSSVTGQAPTHDVLIRRMLTADNAAVAPDQPVAWQAAAPIDTVDGEAAHIQLAVDKTGNVLAVWTQYDGLRYRVYANRSDTSGAAWQGATRIDDDNTGGDSYASRITMNTAGNAIAWWSHADHISSPTITTVTRRFRGDTGWVVTPANAVDTPALPGYGSHALLQLTPDNFALAVWNSREGYNAYSQHNGADVWAPALQIAGLNDARDHALAQSANGRAFSIWTFEDQRDVRNVYVSVFE